MCFMCAMTQQDLSVCNAGPDSTYSGTALYAARVESGDAAASRSTTAVMAVGDTFSGTLGFNGDRDWVRIQLVAGQSYEFTLDGGSLADPYLRLHNSSGAQIAANDDSGTGFNSAIDFTATYTGTYYIAAGAFADGYTGSYVIGASQVAPPEPLRAFTLSEISNQLTHTFWDGQSRGFSVTEAVGTITYNLTGLTAAGQRLARDALAIWSEVSGLNFVATNGSASITFDDSDSGAYATSNLSFTSTSHADMTITSSDVNVSTGWLSSYGTTYDGYAFQTYIHEIGHALGLGHAGNYNGSATYESDADYLNDSWQATIMSYFDQTDNTFINASYAYVVTPMIADILAIQELYGVADDLRTGNTVYGYNSNAGGMYQTLFNGITAGGFDSDVTLTIVDNGGTDTIDLRGESSAQFLNLNAGAISNTFGLIGNLSIALGTTIENGIGGAGDDVIIGNAAANRIIGMNGQDSILAGLGNDFVNGANGFDTLDGGAGNDTVYGGSGNDWIYGDFGWDNLAGDDGNDFLIDNYGNDRLSGGNGNDWMTAGVGRDTLDGGNGNDHMLGGADNDVLYGRNGHDTLIGGAGADMLWGEDGNDVIEGGAARDQLRGGLGSDRFVFSRIADSTTAAPDQIFDFARGIDKIDVSALGATWVGRSAFSGGADELRLHRVDGVSQLELDHNGDGIADMTIVLVNYSNVTASDLIL